MYNIMTRMILRVQYNFTSHTYILYKSLASLVQLECLPPLLGTSYVFLSRPYAFQPPLKPFLARMGPVAHIHRTGFPR